MATAIFLVFGRTTGGGFGRRSAMQMAPDSIALPKEIRGPFAIRAGRIMVSPMVGLHCWIRRESRATPARVGGRSKPNHIDLNDPSRPEFSWCLRARARRFCCVVGMALAPK